MEPDDLGLSPGSAMSWLYVTLTCASHLPSWSLTCKGWLPWG